MSLANVLASAPAAKGLVLLGDPQQLDQPQKGVHPAGTAASALGHILGGRATIDSEQGLFLEETWRMHADVCGFISEVFYDGRLRPKPELAGLRLDAPASMGGTGLRFVPVEHAGNRSESPEEVAVVARLVEALVGEQWIDVDGPGRAGAPVAARGRAHRGAVQRARGALAEADADRADRNRRQVPGPGGARGDLLDGDVVARGRTARDGVPVQREPAERGDLAGAVRGVPRGEPAALRSAVQVRAADGAWRMGFVGIWRWRPVPSTAQKGGEAERR